MAAEVPGATGEDVRAAILEEYAARYEIESGELDEETLVLARELAPEHLPPP